MLSYFPIYTLGSDCASQNLGICALYKDSSLVMYFFYFYTYSFAFLKILLFLEQNYESSI